MPDLRLQAHMPGCAPFASLELVGKPFSELTHPALAHSSLPAMCPALRLQAEASTSSLREQPGPSPQAVKSYKAHASRRISNLGNGGEPSSSSSRRHLGAPGTGGFHTARQGTQAGGYSARGCPPQYRNLHQHYGGSGLYTARVGTCRAAGF